MAKPQLHLERDKGNDLLRWREPGPSGRVLDEVSVPGTSCGCGIEEYAVSPSGDWIVTARCSGQGEWGYDVVCAHPLQRQAGIDERYGYMLDMPVFADDESYLLGGYGEDWLGGWWAHPEDDYFEEPARGGRLTFGWLFTHRLPDHEVRWHALVVTVPAGWMPDDPEAETWMGPRYIAPAPGGGARMVLPGEVPFRIDGPLAETIEVPMPHPGGGRLLT